MIRLHDPMDARLRPLTRFVGSITLATVQFNPRNGPQSSRALLDQLSMWTVAWLANQAHSISEGASRTLHCWDLHRWQMSLISLPDSNRFDNFHQLTVNHVWIVQCCRWTSLFFEPLSSHATLTLPFP